MERADGAPFHGLLLAPAPCCRLGYLAVECAAKQGSPVLVPAVEPAWRRHVEPRLHRRRCRELLRCQARSPSLPHHLARNLAFPLALLLPPLVPVTIAGPAPVAVTIAVAITVCCSPCQPDGVSQGGP